MPKTFTLLGWGIFVYGYMVYGAYLPSVRMCRLLSLHLLSVTRLALPYICHSSVVERPKFWIWSLIKQLNVWASAAPRESMQFTILWRAMFPGRGHWYSQRRQVAGGELGLVQAPVKCCLAQRGLAMILCILLSWGSLGLSLVNREINLGFNFGSFFDHLEATIFTHCDVPRFPDMYVFSLVIYSSAVCVHYSATHIEIYCYIHSHCDIQHCSLCT